MTRKYGIFSGVRGDTFTPIIILFSPLLLTIIIAFQGQYIVTYWETDEIYDDFGNLTSVTEADNSDYFWVNYTDTDNDSIYHENAVRNSTDREYNFENNTVKIRDKYVKWDEWSKWVFAGGLLAQGAWLTWLFGTYRVKMNGRWKKKNDDDE